MMETRPCDAMFSHSSINREILRHIMHVKSESWNYSMLRRLYRLFGKSREHRLFLEHARSYFFEITFRRYRVSNIDSLIQKKIHRSLTPQIVDHFRSNTETNIRFTSLDKMDRCIVRYLAFYYGYLSLCTRKTLTEGSGNDYEMIHKSPHYEHQVITYEFLVHKKIHNLAYYQLVIDSPDPAKRAYRLRQDCSIRGLGVTYELHDIECIKVI